MKKIWIVPLVIILLLVVIYILAGTPFALTIVKNKIESIIQTQIDQPVQIGSLKGNLFYRVNLADCKIGEVCRIDYLAVSYNIFGLLTKKIKINTILIDGLYVDVDHASKIKLKPAEKKEKTAKPFEISIKRLEIYNSNLFSTMNKQGIKLSVNLKCALSSQVLAIEHLDIRTKKSYIGVKGNIPIAENKTFDLKYSIDCVAEEFGIEGLSGIVKISGSVQGTYLHPLVSNNTQLGIIYQKNRITGRLDLNWKIPFLDSLNVNADLSVNTAQNELWEITIKKTFTNIFAGVASAYGNIRLPGSITGSFENPAIKTQVQGKLKFGALKPEINGEITYQNKLLTMTKIRLKEKEFNASMDGVIDLVKSEIIKCQIDIDHLDINIANNFLDKPVPVSGILNNNTQLKGRIENPDITGRLTLESVAYNNEKIGRAEFAYRFKNNTIAIDHGLIDSPRGAINITGTYNLTNNNFSTRIFSELIRLQSPEVFGSDTLLVSGNIGLDIKIYGDISDLNGTGEIHLRDFLYDKWTFDDHTIAFNIKNNNAEIEVGDSRNSLKLRALVELEKDFSFDANLSLHHFSFEQYADLEQAYITAEISAKGELTRPEMAEAEIKIDSLYVSAKENELRNPEPIILEIKNRICHIQKSIITIQKNNVLFEGQVPLMAQDGEIDMMVKAEHIHLGSLYAMFSKEQPPAGYLDMDVTIKGNVKAPQIEGRLNLERIAYSIPGVSIDSVYGLVKFQKTYFDIEYLKGKVNKGRFEINGFAQLNNNGIDTVAVNLLIKNIDYSSSEFGSVIISGTAHFNAKQNAYNLSGDIILDRVIYDKPFNLQTIAKLLTTANRPVQKQNEILKQVYCDIEISSPNGIKIINNIADVSVDADLQIKGRLSKINVYGTVKTSSPGTIKYLGKKFDITNAVIQFDKPYEIDPVLNLEARHNVSSKDGEYEITMLLSGTLEKWQLQLSSIPSIPEQDIISLLLIGRRRPGMYLVYEAKDLDLKGTAKDYALGLARGTLERTAEKGLGFEKFTITGDLFEPRRWDIGFEKKINKNLTLIYGTGIESWEMRRIGINYTINNNLSIFTLHDQENRNSSLDLDLNFRIK